MISEFFKQYGNRDTRYGTDKVITHTYGEMYDSLFAPRKSSTQSLLEIGFSGGYSLLAYSKYFTNAKIVGIDIQDSITANIRSIPNISLIFNDALDINIIKQFTPFDIIVEDASHTYNDQVMLFLEYNHLVKQGGLYIIEDIDNKVLPRLQSILVPIAESKGFSVKVFDFTSTSNRGDDIVMVFFKY